MFNFTHVLNATTGERYYIDKAVLNDNGEGYDGTSNGGNLFQIDLQPESLEGKPICSVDLYVCNNGYAVQISKNLDSESVMLMDAIIEGKTLVVTVDKPET